MADTTPTNKNDDQKDHYIKVLENEVDKLVEKVNTKQTALVRIYRVFGSDMHPCTLDLNTEQRMAWMQELARIASHTVVGVNTAVDKPPKIVGVGVAGEKSGH